jgi:hypothetical protein
MSQTPESRYWAGGRKAKTAVVPVKSTPQAQYKTPKATAIAAVTTMSTVRHDMDEFTEYLHCEFR